MAAEQVERLMGLISGHWVAQALHAVAKLRIPDAIASGHTTPAAIAEEVGAHDESVQRLLRALAGHGLFRSEGDEYRLTEVGQLLRSDVPGSLRAVACFQGNEPHWSGWGAFLHAVKTGKSGFEKVHGKNYFEYCQTDPAHYADFNDAMTGMSMGESMAIAETFDFSGIGTLCDVGGGHGFLMATILKSNSELNGVLFDLPQVVEGADGLLQEHGVADRCRVEGGSFFDGVPAADAYISKHILHDWGDEECVAILKKMAQAGADEVRILIADAVIPEGDEFSVAKMLDLEMLCSTHGGKERSEQQWRELFAEAGLALHSITLTPSPVSVIEARKA